MAKEILKNIIKILDKEISAYEELQVLFEEKRAVLKRTKTEELGIIDNKILALNEKIQKIDSERACLFKKLLGKDGCMSDLIVYSEEKQSTYTEALKERKVKICNNIEKLVLLNNQNMELMRHGLIITNKMLETIVNVFAPQGSIYNEAGKTTDTSDLDMWTVNEEV